MVGNSKTPPPDHGRTSPHRLSLALTGWRGTSTESTGEFVLLTPAPKLATIAPECLTGTRSTRAASTAAPACPPSKTAPCAPSHAEAPGNPTVSSTTPSQSLPIATPSNPAHPTPCSPLTSAPFNSNRPPPKADSRRIVLLPDPIQGSRTETPNGRKSERRSLGDSPEARSRLTVKSPNGLPVFARGTYGGVVGRATAFIPKFFTVN